jgi:hypothetical protein
MTFLGLSLSLCVCVCVAGVYWGGGGVCLYVCVSLM